MLPPFFDSFPSSSLYPAKPHPMKTTTSPMAFSLLGFFSFSLFFALSSADGSIHDLLRSRGLPAGLLPKAVRSYTLDADGRLQVFLDGPCLTKFETRVFFDSVVTANLSYGGLMGVVGLSQEELFLWLPVKDIIVDDPTSGLILFDIGLAHKQLSLSLFEDPPDCKPQDESVARSLFSSFPPESTKPSSLGVLQKNVRKEKGFRSVR